MGVVTWFSLALRVRELLLSVRMSILVSYLAFSDYQLVEVLEDHYRQGYDKDRNHRTTDLYWHGLVGTIEFSVFFHESRVVVAKSL